MRYLVVTAAGGLIQGAEPFKSLAQAKALAKKISEGFDPEVDDVVVLDISIDPQKEQRVYQPLR